MKIKNIFWYETTTGSMNYKPSETVPDQTLTMRQLLERHARGLPLVESGKVPVYLDEEELPDLKKLDLVEIEELKQEVAERVNTNRKTLREIAKQQKAAAEEIIKQKLKEELKQELVSESKKSEE